VSTEDAAPPARRGPGRPSHFPQKRQEIIDHATKLFAKHGFHATTVADICEAAGISKGVLYHYVETKEEILYEIHEKYIQALLERAEAIVGVGSSCETELRELSKVLLRTLADYHEEVTVFLQEWRILLSDQSRWRKVASKRREFGRIVQRVIVGGQEDGVFQQSDPETTTLAFLGMHNYSYQWYDRRGTKTPEAISTTFMDIFIAGLAVRRESPVW
jgi:AcrR family transcriptional regulator